MTQLWSQDIWAEFYIFIQHFQLEFPIGRQFLFPEFAVACRFNRFRESCVGSETLTTQSIIFRLERHLLIQQATRCRWGDSRFCLWSHVACRRIISIAEASKIDQLPHVVNQCRTALCALRIYNFLVFLRSPWTIIALCISTYIGAIDWPQSRVAFVARISMSTSV